MTDEEARIAALLKAAGARDAPDPAMLARMRTQVHANWRMSVRSRRRVPVWAIAASVLVVIGVALSLQVYGPWERNAGTAVAVARLIASPADVRVTRGSRSAQTLDSSTLAPGDEVHTAAGSVTLQREGDSAGALRVDVHSSLRWRSASEVELLGGKLFVDGRAVTGDLTVIAGSARIRHVGTQYIAARSGSAVSVAVREGLVRIDFPETSLEARAGEALAFTTRGADRQRGRAPAGTYWNWAEALAPRLVLEGRDLRGVLEELAYQSGRRLRFTSTDVETKVAATTLHGPALDLPPGEALLALLATTGFTTAAAGTANDDGASNDDLIITLH